MFMAKASGAEQLNFRNKKFQLKHNNVKNPNWRKANQLAIYKRSRGVELGTAVVRTRLEPATVVDNVGT